jgi:threonine aldolase
MLNGMIDLRSDTVTQPTPEMREAMYKAEVGDDVYGDDPTINRLQEMAAAKVGKEAALFVPSGSMGNLTALLTHCKRGDEIIVGDHAHIFQHEVGSYAALGGLNAYVLPNNPDGTLPLDRVESVIRGSDVHEPRTKLIALENTQNMCGGVVIKPQYMHEVRALADKYNLKIHLDGARIFNASVALKVDVKELTRDADSVSFCLSKGLGAPVGSLLCGSKEFIDEARRNRKMLGGGMRQAGILAAAGIVALGKMIDRLAEDHANARRLAEGLADTPGFEIDLDRVQTNLVYFDLAPDAKTSPQAVIDHLLKHKVNLGGYMGHGSFRAVTHVWIDGKDVDQALLAFRTAVKN